MAKYDVDDLRSAIKLMNDLTGTNKVFGECNPQFRTLEDQLYAPLRYRSKLETKEALSAMTGYDHSCKHLLITGVCSFWFSIFQGVLNYCQDVQLLEALIIITKRSEYPEYS